MKTSAQISTQSKSPFQRGACFLLLLVILLPPAVKAGNNGPGKDTSKVYALDDPRNPDCPCHKYQALADKEYALLQGNRNSSDSSSLADESAGKKLSPAQNHVMHKSHVHNGRYWKHKNWWKRHHPIRKKVDGCSIF
ncbi:MAG: hypothetical protein ACHQRM_01105 [Bacteroidia bacterium]